MEEEQHIRNSFKRKSKELHRKLIDSSKMVNEILQKNQVLQDADLLKKSGESRKEVTNPDGLL